MKKQFLFLFLLLFSDYLFAQTVSGYNTHPTKAQIEKDVNAQTMNKYKDHFEVLNPSTLAKKGILKSSLAGIFQANDNNASSKSYLTDTTAFSNISEFTSKVECSSKVDLHSWSATVYDINPRSGMVSCLVAPMGDLNNPIGIFKVYYPKTKVFFTKNLKQAKINNASQIAAAKTQFASVYNTIRQQQHTLEIANEGGQTHLTIPEVATAAILTDGSVIDIQATKDTGKLQFKQGFTVPENAKIITPSVSSLFSTYIGFSDVSMEYFVALLSFFIMYAAIFRGAEYWEEKGQNNKKQLRWGIGAMAGLLLFIPTTQYSFSANSLENTANGQKALIGKHDVMETNWQSFERDGYSLFSDWSNHLAKVTIDSEMQAIINKTGIGTADQIVNAYAGKIMYQHLHNYSRNINNTCQNNFKTNEMKMSTNSHKYKFSNNSSTLFSTDENFAYAMGVFNNERYMYRDLTSNNAFTQDVNNYYDSASPQNGTSKEKIGRYFYPRLSFAACGKNYYKMSFYDKKYNDYKTQLTKLETTNTNDNLKINLISKLVKFQYSLYNDWGYMSVLGLPVTKLFTEMIGGLYENQNDEVLTALNNQIEEGDDSKSILHKVMSSIPYFMLPGVSEVYTITKNSINTAGSMLGNIPFVGGFLNSGVKIAGNIAAIGLSFTSAKLFLAIMPIVGIVVLGILRFALIIAKIFGLHFSALFILPISIVRENVEAIKNFAMKLFATMLELPLFVVAIYLSIVLSGLIHDLGDYFGKKIIIGMLENADASNNIVTAGMNHWINTTGEYGGKMLIYILDGVMQIALSLIAIAIIYKIIVTYHNSILEIIEVKGMQRIDDAADSIRQDAASMGSKI